MKRILFTLLTALVMSVSAWAAGQVVVTGNGVRLRLGPSLRSETLTDNKGVNIHPNKGDKLECLGEASDFYKVKFKGRTVFISKQFATPVNVRTASPAPQPAANGQRYLAVTGDRVRLRMSPSLEGKIYTFKGKTVYLNKGDKLKYMGESGDFYKVNYQGNYLYVSKQYARFTP